MNNLDYYYRLLFSSFCVAIKPLLRKHFKYLSLTFFKLVVPKISLMLISDDNACFTVIIVSRVFASVALIMKCVEILSRRCILITLNRIDG